MSVFFERGLLGGVPTLLILIIVTNPMKWEWPLQLGASLVVVGLGIIVGYTVEHMRKPREDAKPPAASQPRVPKLSELMVSDFPNTTPLSVGANFQVTSRKTNVKTEASVTATVFMDHAGRSKFYGFYIPPSPVTYELCELLARAYEPITTQLLKETSVTAKRGADDPTHSNDLVFSGRVYLYHEDDLSIEQRGDLHKLYKANGLDVQFRGPEYVLAHMPKSP